VRRGDRCAPSTTADRSSSSFRADRPGRDAAAVRRRAEGDTSELVNYRVRGNYMIVDRLFAAAELRFGAAKIRSGPHRPHRWEAGIVSDERDQKENGGSPMGRRSQRRSTSMTTGRSRASRSRRCGCAPSRRASPACRARCWRASAWQRAWASVALGLCAPDPERRQSGQELYSTDNRSTPDGLAGLPKDYTGVPKLGPPLPGDLGRPILNAQNGGHPFRHREVLLLRQSAPARRSNVGRRNWSGSHRALFASTETRPANTATAAQPSATAARNRSRQPRSRRSQPHRRRRIGSSPSTRRQTSAPSRPIGRSAASNVASGRAVISAALITGIRSDLPGRSPRR
jgi:type IV secretion system protein VirB10